MVAVHRNETSHMHTQMTCSCMPSLTVAYERGMRILHLLSGAWRIGAICSSRFSVWVYAQRQPQDHRLRASTLAFEYIRDQLGNAPALCAHQRVVCLRRVSQRGLHTEMPSETLPHRDIVARRVNGQVRIEAGLSDPPCADRHPTGRVAGARVGRSISSRPSRSIGTGVQQLRMG